MDWLQNITRKQLIVGTITTIVVISVLVYFGRKEDGTPANGDNTAGTLPSGQTVQNGGNGAFPVNGSLPPGERPPLVMISAEPVVGGTAETIKNGGVSVKYFKQASGHLFRNTPLGDAEERISNVTIPAIFNVAWSPSKEYAVVSYYKDEGVKHYYIRYTTTSTVESDFLPDGIANITFAPEKDRMAYIIPVNGQHAVVAADPDNTNQKNILTTKIPDPEIMWPRDGVFSIKTKTSAFALSFLYMFDVAKEQLSKVLEGKEGFDILWNPTGTAFLYSETTGEGKNLSLYYYAIKDAAAQKLSITTLPEKCAWSENNPSLLFCAIPDKRYIPASTRLPDDWWQGNVSFNDAFWKINIETGVQEQILELYALDAAHLFTSPRDEYLFFTNKKDGSLWSLEL